MPLSHTLLHPLAAACVRLQVSLPSLNVESPMVSSGSKSHCSGTTSCWIQQVQVVQVVQLSNLICNPLPSDSVLAPRGQEKHTRFSGDSIQPDPRPQARVHSVESSHLNHDKLFFFPRG
ncbi:hypothetical protein AMECASPLE_006643 [Ameca splendens]|uniref:Uncharacterized protein n=1 Tax=Ameca splendens TaxID=208324 RepID=A0ABV0XCJ3_9TELE